MCVRAQRLSLFPPSKFDAPTLSQHFPNYSPSIHFWIPHLTIALAHCACSLSMGEGGILPLRTSLEGAIPLLLSLSPHFPWLLPSPPLVPHSSTCVGTMPAGGAGPRVLLRRTYPPSKPVTCIPGDNIPAFWYRRFRFTLEEFSLVKFPLVKFSLVKFPLVKLPLVKFPWWNFPWWNFPRWILSKNSMENFPWWNFPFSNFRSYFANGWRWRSDDTAVDEISFDGTDVDEISFDGTDVYEITFDGTDVYEITFDVTDVYEITLNGTAVDEMTCDGTDVDDLYHIFFLCWWHSMAFLSGCKTAARPANNLAL